HARKCVCGLRRDPVAVSDDSSPLLVRKVDDIPAFGSESLPLCQGKPRVVTGNCPMLEHSFDAFDEVVTDESIGHVIDRLRNDPASEVGVGLLLLRDDWNLPDAKPSER